MSAPWRPRTAIILGILAGLKPLEERFQGRNKSHELLVVAERGTLSLAALDAALGYKARRVSRYVATPNETPGLEDVSVTMTRLSPKDVDEIEKLLASLQGVRRVSRPGS